MTHQSTILVVDDERSVVELLRGYLEREGFQVLSAHDGSGAIELARQADPDVIILDLMLPGINGLEVCRQIRQFSNAYILMLTARTEEVDRVVGLSVGADDYVTKPFSPRELVARVQALLRRPRRMNGGDFAQERGLRLGRLEINQDAHEVCVDGKEVQLTPLEFQLLQVMASHPGRVFSRDDLIERVWGADFFGDEHVVDVHVSNLRHKLDAELVMSHPPFIETVRGVGYRFRRAQE